MPALTLNLLAQIMLQLQRQTTLTTAEPLRYLLEVVRANRGLRQLA